MFVYVCDVMWDTGLMGVSHRETRREGKDRRNEIQKVWVRQWEAEVEQSRQ